MNVTPFPVVHIHVPVWVCVVALLILAAALAWDVLGTQVVRDQIEQAADDATQGQSRRRTRTRRRPRRHRPHHRHRQRPAPPTRQAPAMAEGDCEE